MLQVDKEMWEYKWDEQEVKGIKDLPGEGLKIGTVRLPLVSNPAEKVLYPLLWEYEREERRRTDQCVE